MMQGTTSKQRGAVSIFIVVFTALLVTIVTTSFIQIMLRNQEQATNNDLSQSAYDSALAGVEDAKRALITLKQCERNSAPTVCTGLREELASDECDSLGDAGIVTFDANGEVEVGNDPSLNQAYTCVKVDVTTKSVQGELDENGAVVIPLDSDADDDTIRSVEISWFNGGEDGDLPTGTANFTGITPTDLPAKGDWPTDRPPIMRAQLIQFEKGSLRLSDLENSAKARFLYPTNDPIGKTADFADDTRRSTNARNNPIPIECENTIDVTGYICTATVDIPPMTDREAYLQLATYYGGAHYRVRLIGPSGNILDFDGVQPEVDSTGRASDLFRRVKANIFVSTAGVEVPFPPAALAIRGSLCKDFFITDNGDDYLPSTDAIVCDPAN